MATVKKSPVKPRVGQGLPGPGRPKGVPNKVTIKREAEIAASGLTPLEYMLTVLRDAGNDQAQRLDAAKSAAPYVHPRLSTVEAKVSADVTHRLTEIINDLVGPAHSDR